jgi:hypothetical protein
MTTTASATLKTPVARKQRVPDTLVRETINGIPFYYAGYKQVLAKRKSKAEIMAYSSLLSFILEFFNYLLADNLSRTLYRSFVGETGSHIEHASNLSLDIAVYEKSKLTNDKINNKYTDVPPKLVIEVDLKIEWADPSMSPPDVVNLKTQKLFDFGTEKVIWVFTRSKKILVAENGKDWIMSDWDKDLTLIHDIRFNLGQYLAKEGVLGND